MNKRAYLVIVLVLAVVQLSLADYYFNRLPLTQQAVDDLEAKGKLTFKCVPGRTVIKFQERSNKLSDAGDHDESDDDFRRSHMNYVNYGEKDESCQICVCSVEGQDEHCSRRPAANVNECIVMNKAKDEFNKNIPFSHDRDLSMMIRRDYIWHRDEIPYESDAKCYRGTSFYSNNPNANSTDISQIGSDLDSLLGYDNQTICYFCVCSASGNEIACINRDPYFCDYYRMLGRDDDAARDLYTTDFGQDRSAYFRLLSFRMRRTLDGGVYDLIETAGSKINGECVPYVSEYTDCNRENQCLGCTRCTCSPEGSWVCKKVRDCPREYEALDEKSVGDAFDSLLHEFKSKNGETSTEQIVVETRKPEENILVSGKKDEIDLEGEILSLIREKRSPKSKKEDEDLSKENIIGKKTNGTKTNNTIIFYHTVDELDEDTLKNSNVTGTLEAKKIEINVPSRRTNSKDNATFDPSLQIKYSKPQNYHQILDNKIDSNHSEFDLLDQEQIGIMTNQTQEEKDKELSKIIVNELKVGKELIGGKNAPVMSNITFTPENDTLTAMAFIAGNLLNKLWDMEKEASEDSLELEAIKNEKLQDLLELFKEPLTMRQEAFLKNALESLSRAIEKHKEAKNISICESIDEARKFVEDSENMNWEKSEMPDLEKARKNGEKTAVSTQSPLKLKQNIAAAKAVSNINLVLSLMKKYELNKKRLSDLKHKKVKVGEELPIKSILNVTGDHSAENISENGTNSLNLFGNILEKITKLLLPYKSSKKMVRKIKNTSIFVKNEDALKKKIKDVFNTDIGNTTLTIKDRIILDYLIQTKKNPRSLFDDDDEIPSYNEKDILLNLSEFFKMKSLVDLVKMLGEDKAPIKDHLNKRYGDDSASEAVISTTEVVTKTTNYLNQNFLKTVIGEVEASSTESPKKFASTKDRLKAHLRTILDDLIELNKESGATGKNFELANALPCIYNILKGTDGLNISSLSVDPYKRLSKDFEEIKQEYRIASAALTRRMDRKEIRRMLKDTPKSALVWERVVKNVEKSQKQNARRNADIKAPIPIKDLVKNIENLEEISSSYSRKILKRSLDPIEQLMILKSFHAEEQRTFDTLKDIKASIDIIMNLTKETQEEITDFVYKAANKAKFHSKMLDYIKKNTNLNKPQSTKSIQRIGNKMLNTDMKIEPKNAKLIDQVDEKNVQPKEGYKKNKNFQLTRDEILNQLIRNRVSVYLTSLQGKSDDPNYNIAKSILQNLDDGNVHLAKQLYKIFVTNKKQSLQNVISDKSLTEKIINTDKLISEKLNHGKALVPALAPSIPMIPEMMAQLRRQSILEKEPLIHFENPRYYNNNNFLSARRDQMLRNMLASKNLRLF